MSSGDTNYSILQNAARVALEASRQVSASIVKGVQGPFADYTIEHSSSIRVGPWRVERANHNKKNGDFCIWSFDKQSYRRTYNLGQHEVDKIFELCKKDARQCASLRHPYILKIVEPVFETKRKIAFVSEGIVMTLGAVSCDFTSTARVSSVGSNEVFHSKMTFTELSVLEIKFGIFCLCEAISFLHEQAQLVHLSISPHSVVICDDHSFKLCGFEHSRSIARGCRAEFDFRDSFTNSMAISIDHPFLEWTAPELVDVWTTNKLSVSCDYFSFSLLSLWLLRGEKIIPDGCSIHNYNNILAKWDMSCMNNRNLDELSKILFRQLERIPESRPSVTDCLACLSKEESIQPLLFLTSASNKTSRQKESFLKAILQGHISLELGKSLTTNFLLPFVLGSIKDASLRGDSVCLLMKLCDKIDISTFRRDVVPVIREILDGSSDFEIEQVGMNVQNISFLLGDTAGGELVISIHNAATNKLNPANQKIILENIGSLVPGYPHDIQDKFGYLYIDACARTTSGQVRAVCLKILYQCINAFSVSVTKAIFEALEKISRVDQSGNSSADVARLIEGICLRMDIGFCSNKGLPLLIPMLSHTSLSIEDFNVVFSAVQKILRRIKEWKTISTSKEEKLAFMSEAYADYGMAQKKRGNESLQNNKNLNIMFLGESSKGTTDPFEDLI